MKISPTIQPGTEGIVRLAPPRWGGFNKMDTSIGHALAEAHSFSPGQCWLCAKFAVKYHRQLPDELVETLRPLLGAKKEIA